MARTSSPVEQVRYAIKGIDSSVFKEKDQKEFNKLRSEVLQNIEKF
ncbi:MAG: hypothetical protein RCG15_01590 [Candidatus Rickettsia vulgarisii]